MGAVVIQIGLDITATRRFTVFATSIVAGLG
jgi:hypothetical protein